MDPTSLDSLGELWPIAALAALDLDKLPDQLPVAAIEVACNRRALGIEFLGNNVAEAAIELVEPPLHRCIAHDLLDTCLIPP